MIYRDRLESLRIRKGLTQNICGSLINLDSGTYNNYEKEKIILPCKHVITLCNYFDVSIDYMFNLSNQKQYEKMKNSFSKDMIGQRLKTFRKNNKLSLKELAKIVGCSYATISGYESGRYLISTPILYRLCNKYRISADYLLGRVDIPMYLEKEKNK